MSFYLEIDIWIRDKVKVISDLSNYDTKKELEHATYVDTWNLATKSYFIPLKSEVDKINIYEMVKVTIGFNTLNFIN